MRTWYFLEKRRADGHWYGILLLREKLTGDAVPELARGLMYADGMRRVAKRGLWQVHCGLDH